VDQVFGAEGGTRSRVVLNLGPLRYVFAAVLLGVGYFVGQEFRQDFYSLPATSDPVRLAAGWGLPIYTVAFELGLLCFVAWTLRAATIFHGDVVQIRGLLRQRRAVRADIAGYKLFAGENACLELHLRNGKKFRAHLFPFYSGRKKLEYVDAWLKDLPNFDAIAAEKFRLELSKRGLLDRRLREIDRFECLVKRVDDIGFALIFSVFLAEGAILWWKPLEPVWRAAMWIWLGAPFYSLVLTMRARQLYSAGDVRVHPGYPGFQLIVMGGLAGAATIAGMASGFEPLAGRLTADAVTIAAAAVGAVIAPVAWLALRPSRRLPRVIVAAVLILFLWGAGLGAQLAALARDFGLVSAI
jgi:hypothetical protein